MTEIRSDFPYRGINETNVSCLKAIQETEGDLGLDDTIDLLVHALPLISERKNVIGLALGDADLDKAAMYAHKTLGSIRLYGSQALEALLTKLKNKQISGQSLEDFQYELAEEFEFVSLTINNWLKLKQRIPNVA